MTLAAVFHHFPPFPGAGALRARSICDALAARLEQDETFVALTTLADAAAGEGLGYRVESVGADPGDNRDRLYQRVLTEITLGITAGRNLLKVRPKAVVLSTPGYLFAATVYAFLRGARIPYVLDVRDLYPEVYAGAGLLKANSVVYRLFATLTKSMYRHAEGVVGATAGLAEAIGAISGRTDVAVSYNGFPRSLRSVSTPKKARFTVCFHGVMGFYQDIESLLLCARALEHHDIDVLVIGYGRKEAILTTTPPANLMFMGKLSFVETIQAVSACHVGLCLRTDEPISRDAVPVKVFEYLGLSMPVVVTPPSEGGGLVERIGAGSVHASGDIDAIVSDIVRMRDEPHLLSSRCVAAQGLGERFTRETQADHFAVYAIGALSAKLRS